jgi:hypothetical protein
MSLVLAKGLILGAVFAERIESCWTPDILRTVPHHKT